MANHMRSRKRHERGRNVPSSQRTEGRKKRFTSRHPQGLVDALRPGTVDSLVEINGQLFVAAIKTENNNG